MASPSTNNLSTTPPIDSSKTIDNQNDSSGKVSFGKRAVKILFIGLSTPIFPIMMAVALINELYHSYGNTQSRTVKIKNAVATMIFTVPVLGPIVVMKLGVDLYVNNQIFRCTDVMKDDYSKYCMPFKSTVMTGFKIANHNLGIKDGNDEE
ncbi:MAG: hypothetical protein KAG53_05115 [Endozoicomonadaceae bacterium]|nr:hypothetical protein [Endozoicomonadaceae bacterium]